MRNGILLDAETVVTIDNAGCLGEKELDAVQAPNAIVAAFTLRVSILEQWCAGAIPVHIFMANFTGDSAWDDYVQGFQSVFDEIGETMPPVVGSTESNFTALQSGLSVTVIGKKQFAVSHDNVAYFIIGEPLVGQQVLENPNRVAKLGEIYTCLCEGLIKAIWPCGSKGLQHEVERFVGNWNHTFPLDGATSAGPSAAVLVAVDQMKIDEFKRCISSTITPIVKAK